MTRALFAAAALAAIGILRVSAAPAPRTPDTLRILSYNIHHGEGMDGVFDLTRLAGIVTREQPDLVALQEVDQATDRSGQVRQADELARLTHMHLAFGKAMDFQNGEYGVAVLSRWPLLHVDNRALPTSGNLEPRTALTVEVEPAETGSLVAFTCTHLDQGRDNPNRILQAAYLNHALAREDGAPSILAGDMNSRVDTDVMQTLRSWWTDMFVEPPPLNPLERPRYRVDYVMARPGDQWRTVEARAIDEPVASDHRPVLAVLEWSGGER